MFYRDEVFNVKVTVTGTQAYKLQLGFAKGETHQTLGSRGSVQMYDFENDGILVFSATERTKTLKAVINTAQIVRLKVTKARDNASNPEPPALAETGDIHIVHRLRKYGLHVTNLTVNDYDSYIDEWVNYWDDWKIPAQTDKTKAPEHYTFMTEAVPSGDLVKAVAYKERSLKGTGDLMQVTGDPLIDMTTGNGKSAKRDVNAADLPLDYEGGNLQLSVTPRMNYGTPTDDTTDDSFRWGIRWLIDKRTFHDYNTSTGYVFDVKVIDWWGPTGALKHYNGEDDKIVSYPASVEKLYAEGKNPHPGHPKYLWPVKVDGTARGNTPETPAENPENPPAE